MELNLEENLLLEHPIYYLSNYFTDLRTQVDVVFVDYLLQVSNQTNKNISKTWTQMIDKINQFEEECIKNSYNLTNDIINKTEFLFQNKTILFLKKTDSKDKSLFKTNETKLILVHDFYIPDRDLQSLLVSKNDFKINGCLTMKKLKIKELIKQLENTKQIDDIFLNLNKLNVLRLQFNKITSIESNLFKECSNLQEMNLSSNCICFMDSNSLEGLINLKVLNLSNNNLDSFEFLNTKDLNKLEILRLNLNKLKTIKSNQFKYLVNLKELDLSFNRINLISKENFIGLQNLESLKLSINEIKSVDSNTLSGLNNLKILCLDKNQINSISSNAFQNLLKLQMLDLNFNQLDYLDNNLFSELNNLKLVNLSRNLLMNMIEPKFIINSNFNYKF